MDVYRLINSTDISSYLREINYSFTVPEIAFLIYQSNCITQNEKINRWKEIIDTMPDCSMEERLGMAQIDSFHQFLNNYIKLQYKLVKLFNDSNNSLYTYEVLEQQGERWQWCKADVYFKEFSACQFHMKKIYDGEVYKKSRFIKSVFIDNEEQQMENEIVLEMNPLFEILAVDEYGLLTEKEETLKNTFEGMYFSFPLPFSRGDILINVNDYNMENLFVLDCISCWTKEDLLNNGFGEAQRIVKEADCRNLRHKEYGDTSDMNYTGYYMGKENSGRNILWKEISENYLDLERYKKPLEGRLKVLPLMGDLLLPKEKRKFSVDFIYNSLRLILEEENYKTMKKYLECFQAQKNLRDIMN